MFIRTIKDQINQFLLNSYIINKNFLNQQDILAQNYLAPLSTFYLPWSDRAMRPSGMVKVLNDILINNHSEIVECGSGISTFYMASLLKRIGGHIYSVDHDEKWLEFIRVNLLREGLDEIVTTIHAPLKSTELAIDNAYWYDTGVLDKEIDQDKKIELLLVDGPPAQPETNKYSRYPALPYFASRLASDFTIILDDINRSGEQEIAKKWSTILNIPFKNRYIDGGVAIGRSQFIYTL